MHKCKYLRRFQALNKFIKEVGVAVVIHKKLKLTLIILLHQTRTLVLTAQTISLSILELQTIS